MTDSCARCGKAKATVWIAYQGQKAKVFAFCEIAIAREGW